MPTVKDSPVNTVDAKILAIMSEIESVPKNGFNSFSNYKYVTERDAIDAVRVGCIKHKLVIYPSLISHDTGYFQEKKGGYSTVLMEYRIVDVDTGHERAVQMPGSALDSHDKSIYKAITGSMKYQNLKLFLIGGEDDAEADSPMVGTAPRQSIARSIRGKDTGKLMDPHHKPAAPFVGSGALILPPYGPSPGERLDAVSAEDLQQYAVMAERAISNPAKKKWLDTNTTLLQAIEAQLTVLETEQMVPGQSFTRTVDALNVGIVVDRVLMDWQLDDLNSVPQDRQQEFIDMVKAQAKGRKP